MTDKTNEPELTPDEEQEVAQWVEDIGPLVNLIEVSDPETIVNDYINGSLPPEIVKGIESLN